MDFPYFFQKKGDALPVEFRGQVIYYLGPAPANLPITAETSAVRVQGGWLPFYLVLLPMAELHVGIGCYRLGVKYGYITRSNRKKRQFREYMLMIFFILFSLLALWRLWALDGQEA